MDGTIRVPISRPPSYAPAWAEKAPGLRVSRTLDLADLLVDRGVRLASVSVELEPPLLADAFLISDVAVTFFLLDAPAADARTRWRVRFSLQFTNGAQDEVIAWQPIGAGVAATLVSAYSTATIITVGGSPIAVGAQLIHA